MTIQSWKSQQAEAIFNGKSPGEGFPADLMSRTRRRLQRLDAATTLEDLRAPPSHRLHLPQGERAGEWSTGANDQLRVMFKWGAAGAEGVRMEYGYPRLHHL